MSKYAIIKIKGTQYKVSEGDEILVDSLGGSKPEAAVLLVSDSDKVEIGKPQVKGVKIKLKVIKEEEKGKKIYVIKYKAKSRYRRKYGFRPVFSKLLVEKISI